ncbi:hypothetical protein PAMP_020437 [Pampus punctatissimus]
MPVAVFGSEHTAVAPRQQQLSPLQQQQGLLTLFFVVEPLLFHIVAYLTTSGSFTQHQFISTQLWRLLAGTEGWSDSVRSVRKMEPAGVYLINVTYSDNTSHIIYRRYSKFFDLQKPFPVSRPHPISNTPPPPSPASSELVFPRLICHDLHVLRIEVVAALENESVIHSLRQYSAKKLRG